MIANTIWTEKYRPSTFSEVVGQELIVKQLKAFVEEKNMPHIMFAGPAGVGKSTLALVLAKEFFGESYKDNFLELNASDERGIDVIRNKVKDFARTKAIGHVPFKLIFLDECDALTKEAQQALRRTMENYTSSTRFILSCNYASKIIDPIQSRCTVYKFRPLDEKDLDKVVKKLESHEKFKLNEDANKALIYVVDGDCRKLENILQAAASFDKAITKELIYSISNIVDPKQLRDVLKEAVEGKFEKARTDLLKLMINNGLSGIDIIKQIQKEILELELNAEKKVLLVDKCGEIEFRMVEGSDEFIQLEALLAYFALQK
jgi:replication factor C small subunit